MNDGALIRPPRGTSRNTATAPGNEQAHTRPQRGRPQRPRPFVASERAGARPLQGLTWSLPSDPSRQARNPQGFGGAYRLCRLAQWGSTTRQRRGAEGGHYGVYEFDLQAGKNYAAAGWKQQQV